MIGRVIRKIRTTIYKMSFRRMLNGAVLFEVPRIYFKERVHLGKHVRINDGVFIHAAGGVSIGEGCVLSHGVSLISTGLDMTDWKNRDVTRVSHVDKPIVIGNNVWLGANVVVCAGVTIAPNCIVGAGAVVTRDLKEENCLYGGIPARKIRDL